MNKNNFNNLIKLSNEHDNYNKSNKLSKSELLNNKTLFIDESESFLNKINKSKLKYNNLTNQLDKMDDKLTKLMKK